MAEKLSKKELRSYMEEQLDLGHTVGHITDHLMKYGHARGEIEAIFEEILGQEEKRKRSFFKRSAEILFIILFILFVFWVGVSSDSPGEAIFIGFLPTIIFIIITFFVVEKKLKKNLLVAAPLAIAFLFYISGTLSSLEVFQGMDISKLTLLNLILSYIFVLMMNYADVFSMIRIFPEEKEEFEENDELREIREIAKGQKEIPERPREEYVEIPEKHESLKKVVESIESNCKALNSAIGRVYRKSNGGTSLVRDLIEVKSEWYNGFRYLLTNHPDKTAIYGLLDKIEKRLNVLFRKEHELFGAIQFKNLKRDPNGNSRVIDVLMMNDNDPVQTYFENALMACGDAKEIIGEVK